MRIFTGAFVVAFAISMASCRAQDVAACKAPSAIQSTHTMIPYPVISQRMGERGATRLVVSLGADGAPTDVSISKGSGSRRLDDAASAHIKTHYRWQPSAEGCSPAARTVEIGVNWWLDPLPNPSAIAAGEGIEVIDVHGQCINIWAYDGPNGGTSGSAPCRAP